MRWRPTLQRAAVVSMLASLPSVVSAQETEEPDAEEVAVDIDWTPIDSKIAQGDWQGAGDQLAAILDDELQSDAHGAAWGRLGRALHGGGLPFAAMSAWLEGLALDAHALAEDYPTILDTAAKVGVELAAGELMGADMSVTMSDETRRRVAYLAARYHFSKGSWGTTLGLLPLVGEDGDVGLDAMILRGIALSQQSRYPEALPPLLAAYEKSKRAGRTRHQLATLALNIARTFFATGNYARAMEYYGKVGRDDAYWPQAHFERAWAHFRVDDMSGTVGLLHTHGSPFFDGWYFPEADLLRAQSFFLMCKFPEAIKTIDSFQANYTPVQEMLGETLGQLDAEDAFAEGREYLAGQQTKLPAVVLRKLGWDDRFQASLDTIALADADLAKLTQLSSRALATPTKDVTARHAARIRTTEGERILTNAREATADLADMLQGIELTRIDLLTLEADMYSRAATTGEKIEFEDPIGKLRKLKKKGWQVWPFQGEYWADELGWYKVTGRPECPASMQRGDG